MISKTKMAKNIGRKPPRAANKAANAAVTTTTEASPANDDGTQAATVSFPEIIPQASTTCARGFGSFTVVPRLMGCRAI